MQIIYRLFRKSRLQIRQRVHRRLWLVGCLFLVFLLPNLQGEGSKDFIGYDGVRLFYSADVHQQLKVYANEGEYLNFGTSHLGISGGEIHVFRPNGQLFQVYTTAQRGEVGRILNSVQEMEGPTGGVDASANGYIPLTIGVGAGEAGVWTVLFKYQNPDRTQPTFNPLQNAQAWGGVGQASQPTQRRGVLAWDITVSQSEPANLGGVQLTGRVYSNEYVSVTGNFGPQTSPTFYILTRGGFQYEIEFDRADPFEFPLLSNSVGIIDGNLNPIYSSRRERRINRVTNLDGLDPDAVYLYDPQSMDVGSIITNKIFFNLPDPNLPASTITANIMETIGLDNTSTLSGSASFETWLYNEPIAEAAAISNLEFIGSSELCEENTTETGAGGAFIFNSTTAGAGIIRLDINNDGDYDDETDVEIREFIGIGRDTIFWDGNDGLGNPLTAIEGTLSVTIQVALQRAEIHIMVDDVENNIGGISFNLLNGPDVINANRFFYDHRVVNGTTSGLSNDGRLLPTQTPHTYMGSFGDSLILDYFNFIARAEPINESLSINIVDDCSFPPVDDFDMDGVPDMVDIDDDNDGVLDRLEFCNPDGGFACLPGGVDPSGDEDEDGTQNFEDANDVAVGNVCNDEDGDGVCDSLSGIYDTDGDGVPDHRDLDSDNDGITDLYEAGHGQADANADGIIDGPNADFGVNGFFSGIETDDTVDADPTYTRVDKDGDGVPDHDDLDSDNDGILDVAEAGYVDLDSDNDGRIDYESVNQFGIVNVIDPANTGEGIMNPIDFDGDGVPDFHDLDSDNDGINDVTEATLILIQDPDGDGIIREGMPAVNADGVAIIDSLGIILVISSMPIDFDNDGIPDFHDLDSENDGILDAVEGFTGDFDPDFDGILGTGIPTVNDDGQVTSADTTSTSDPTNTDGDELADFRDRDSDDDGIADINECDGTAMCVDVDDDGIDDYREPNCTIDNTPITNVVANDTGVFCSDTTSITYTVTNTGFNAGDIIYAATLPDGSILSDTLVDNTAIITVSNLTVNGQDTMRVVLIAENGCVSETVAVLIDCEQFECTEENTPNVFVQTNTNGTACPGDSITYTVQSTGFQEGDLEVFGSFPDGQEVTGTIGEDRLFTVTVLATDTLFTGDGLFHLIGTNGCPSDTAQVNIFIAKVDAKDDGFSVNSGETLENANILLNDDSRDVNVMIVMPPNNGMASINEDGTLNYTSNADYLGQDTLTYSICNMTCMEICDTAQVIIENLEVECTPDNTPILTIDLVSGNTTSCPGDSLNFTFSVANFLEGTNVFLFSPSDTTDIGLNGNFNIAVGDGGDFVFIATNANNCADTVTFNVMVNETAVANDDNYSLNVGETLSGVNIFDNDTNNGGTFSIISNFQNGAGMIDMDGNLTYAPNSNFFGVDSLTYEICDVNCTDVCIQATVAIQIGECTPATTTDLVVNFSEDLSQPVCPNTILNYTYENNGFSEGDITVMVTFTDGSSASGNINDGGSTIAIDAINGVATFIATAENGCKDTVTATIIVAQLAMANDDNYSIGAGEMLTDVNIFDNDTNNGGTFTIITDFQNGTGMIDADGNLIYTPNDDFVGMDMLVYEICDAVCTDQCSQATVTINVDGCTAENSPAIGEFTVTPDNIVCPGDDLTFMVTNTGFAEGIITATLTLPNGDMQDFVVATGTGSSVTIGDIQNTFDYNGTASVVLTAENGCMSEEATLEIIAPSVNAMDDSYTVDAGQTLTGVNIFDNDTNNGGTFTIITDFQNGTGMIDADGNLTYTPNADFIGMDMLVYEICDAVCTDQCSQATVTINVDGCTMENSPAIGEFTVTPDNIVCPGDDLTFMVTNTGFAEGIITATLTLPNGDMQDFVVATGTGSSVTIEDIQNTFDYNGTASVVLTAENGCMSEPATLEIVAPSVNAMDDNYTVDAGQTLTGVNILVNDSFGEGSLTVLDEFDNGTATVTENGDLTYTPNEDFVGMDTLTYQICNALCTSVCDTAQVIVDVMMVECNEETTPTITAFTLTPSGKLCPGDEATFMITGGGFNEGDINYVITLPDGNTLMGTLNAEGTGMVTIGNIAPNNAGSATVVLTSVDNGCMSAPANVDIIVATVTANDDNYTTQTDMTLMGVNVLDNDDADNVTITIIEAPANGVATIANNGDLIYTPNDGFAGTDMFTYQICDADCPDVCDMATVTITIEDPCADKVVTANDDDTSTDQGVTLNGNVLNNDEFDNVTISVTTEPANGILTLNDDGSFEYIPNSDFFGTDSFTYQICEVDCPDVCSSATVTITVIEMMDPCDDKMIVAVDDSYDTNQGEVLTGVNVLDNDDFEMATITVGNVTGGTATIGAAGNLTFTPTADFSGNATIAYTICDVECPDVCDSATVTVNVISNADPCDTKVVDAVEDNFTAPFRGTLSENVLTNDVIETVTVTLNKNVDNGTLTLNNDGTFSYTPNRDFYGDDTFSYRICDVECPDICDETTVTLSVEDPGCFIPNYMTPNGDGDNDVFEIPCAGNVFPNNRLTIYNRWGDIIFETDNYQNNWGATYDGEPVAAGAYFYLFQPNRDNEECESGFLTVVK